MSKPSMTILPSRASTKRKKACIIVLLPQPVGPTMPIFSPALIEKLSECRTSGSASA